jgi:hypothetical protein
MTSLQLSGSALPNWGLYLELATIVNKRGTSTENAKKGDSLGDSPSPYWDPVLSAKVTTLSVHVSRWKVGGHLLWIDGPWGLLFSFHFLVLMLKSLGSHNGRKAKGHFPPRQWSLFLCLTILSWFQVQ